jgi:hypothetical protein
MAPIPKDQIANLHLAGLTETKLTFYLTCVFPA